MSAPAFAEDVPPVDVIAPVEETSTPVEEEPEIPSEEEPAQESTDEVEIDDSESRVSSLPIPGDGEALASTLSPYDPVQCAVYPDFWYSQNTAPVRTPAGLVFSGGAASVNYYQVATAGNMQGLSGMSYTVAPGSTGFGVQLKVEVNPRTQINGPSSPVATYTTLSTIGNEVDGSISGTINAQDGLWYSSRTDYDRPGGMGHPLTWSQMTELMPLATLISGPSLHLQTNAGPASYGVVTSVTSSCGTTDFAAPTTPINLSPSGFVVETDAFTWGASADNLSAVTYEVITGNHPSVGADGKLTSGVVAVATGITGTSLDYNFVPGPLFFQVRATDASGNKSAWSAPSPVNYIGVPQVTSPTEGEVVTGNSVTITWSPSFGIDGVDKYRVQVRSDTDGLPGLESETIDVAGNLTSLTISGLSATQQQGAMTVQVRAIYNRPLTAGVNSTKQGPWSERVRFSRDSIGPVGPQPLNPENGKTQANATPTLEWLAVTDAVSYQVRTSTSPWTIDGELAGGTQGNYDSNGLTFQLPTLADGVLFWQVRGVDANDNIGTWSSVWSLGVDITGPIAPQPYNPENGKTQAENRPVLEWLTVPDAVSYQVRTSTSPWAPEGELAGGTQGNYTSTGLTYQLPTLTDGAIFWQVRGLDSLGNLGAWSSVWSLGVDTTGPAAVQPLNPENGKTQSNSSPTLEWIAVPDAVVYQVRSSVSPSRNNNGRLDGSDAANLGRTSNLSFPLSNLDDGALFWQVRGFDALGNAGSWSPIWSLGVDTVGPTAPVLTAPDSGVTTANNAPTLTWDAIEDDARYQVRVAQNDDTNARGRLNGTGAISLPATTNAFLALTNVPNGTVYWQVRAIDAAGNRGAWSTVWSFGVDTEAPDAVTLSAPGNGTTDVDGNLSFSWSAVEEDASYEFEVTSVTPSFTEGGSFTDLGIGSAATTTSTGVTTTAPNGVYSWHVRATDEFGNVGSWSEVWTVTVAIPAPATPVVAPAAAPAATPLVLTPAPAAAATAPAPAADDELETEAPATEEEDLSTEAVDGSESETDVTADPSSSQGDLSWIAWILAVIAAILAAGAAVLVIRRRSISRP